MNERELERQEAMRKAYGDNPSKWPSTIEDLFKIHGDDPLKWPDTPATRSLNIRQT